MKVKFVDQSIFTLQNFLTSLLIIKSDSNPENLVEAASIFIFLSLNTFLLNSTYIEFILKCRMMGSHNTSKFGFGSILIFLVIAINLVFLIISSSLFQSSILTVICVVSSFTIPMCEAARQYHLNIAMAKDGLLLDSFCVLVQFLSVCIFWQLGQINSFTILVSWLLPSWIVAPFVVTKLVRNYAVVDLIRYKELGYHLGTLESILSALQLWFLLKVLNSFYDYESMAAFVIGITLSRPLFMISTLLRSLKLTDIYSTDKFLRDRILNNYFRVIVICFLTILALIWFGVGDYFTNLENGDSYRTLYSVILFRITLGFLYANLYYTQRVNGRFGKLLFARVVEWATIYALILILNSQLNLLQMNLCIILGTLIHFALIRNYSFNISCLRKG